MLYDQDQQRSKKLQRYLENKDIQVKAVYCLKDFLTKIEKPALKIIIIERTLVEHYNLNIEDVLARLGLTFIVIVYTETKKSFDFSIHYVEDYFYFPFTTEADKKLFKSVKKCLKKRKKKKEKRAAKAAADAPIADRKNITTAIQNVLQVFSPTQKILISQLIEKEEGLTAEGIIQLLNAESVKNTQNYVQVQIYRLRNKLSSLLGKEYTISCNHHVYQLVYIPQH